MLKGIHFNSNMVRLKVGEQVAGMSGTRLFQFQYGAIKSWRLAKAAELGSSFQFQYGAIKS